MVTFIDNFLVNNGFALTKSSEANSDIYNYCKKNETNILRIGFIITKENENISFWGFSIYLNFLNLEEIVIPILVKNNLVGKTLLPANVYNSFFIDLNFEIPCIEKYITDADTIEVKEKFLIFYNQNALPFFEKWKDLSVLYEYIKDKTEDELWDILGQFAPMKKAVILKLCNDPNYQSFMDSYFQKQKEYFEQDPEDIDNIRYYNASKELKEILDKTEPVYNL